MTYKLGDRVVIKENGLTGMITSEAGRYTMLGITLDEKWQLLQSRVYYSPDKIEHDKNYIVTQILEDL